MLKRVIARVRKTETGGVAKNAAWLITLQLATYGLPLLTVPYLSRVFAVRTYGEVALISAIQGYAMVVVDWGAGLGATRDVAQSRDDPAGVRAIFWQTIASRIMLTAGSCAVILALCFMPGLSSLWPLLVSSLLAIFAATIATEWFLQGMERMGVTAMATLITRFASVPLTFLLVHKPADAWISVALNGGVAMIASIYALQYSLRTYKLGPLMLPWRQGAKQIVEHRHYFGSRIAIMLYTASTPIILTAVAGAHAVGLYAAAEKLARVPIQVINQISSAIFPRMSAILVTKPERGPLAVRYSLWVQGGLGLAGSIALFIAAPFVAPLLLGHKFDGSVTVLQWLSPSPLLIGLSGAIGIQGVLALGLQRAFAFTTVASGVVFVGLSALLGHLYGANGAAAAFALTELFVLVLMTIVLWRQKPDFFRAIWIDDEPMADDGPTQPRPAEV